MGKGWKHTEDAKNKIRVFNLGRKRPEQAEFMRHNNPCQSLKVRKKISKKAIERNPIWVPMMQKKNKGLRKGKIWEQIYGVEKAKQLKEKQRERQLGKPGYKFTAKEKLVFRKLALKNKLGGRFYKKMVCYTCKNGDVVNLDSSYELTVATELDKNNVKWSRPKPFWYVDLKKIKHRYYPDFYLSDYNVYLDPKNDYLIKNDAAKIQYVREQNNIQIIILNKDELNWKVIQKKLTLVVQLVKHASF